MPTYKQSFVGDVRQDGVFNANGISFLSLEDLTNLDKFLVQTDNLLIIKLHPMDVLQNYEFPSFENLIIIKQKDFKEQLYPLLGACSYLLTDYSSVWVDYCILKRPIGFVMNDVEEYRNSRGFTIDNLLSKLPGSVIESYKELLVFINELPKFQYKDITYYNSFLDNCSARRISERIF